MKSKRVFIGNIYQNENIQNEHVILIQAKNSKYLELQKTKKILNRLALEFPILQNSEFISNNRDDQNYVNENELMPYITKDTEIDLKRVRKIHKK